MANPFQDLNSDLVKGAQKSPTESRQNRVVKRSKEKRPTRVVDPDTILEAIDNNSSETESILNTRDKRSQGVVIDGRTYTCAACKAGHRVGVCKHAGERPMTATHPPGRPPAGAPKKVVCDCPKQCKCKKRDCKCARNCSCTQMMYMLVYIPAPQQGELVDEVDGTWKIDKEVITDLKGHPLTSDQVQQRQAQKVAQKSQSIKRAGGVNSTITIDEVGATKLFEQESTPAGSASCCSHKENIALQKNVVATAKPSGSKFVTATRGCNCGQNCTCTFCPEHPNNAASISMARQQAMHFTNQYRGMNEQSIMPFVPALPQSASCMGYAPRYAVSTTPGVPSEAEMQRLFSDQTGFMLSYPFWSLRTNAAGYTVAPFPMQNGFPSEMGMVDDGYPGDLQTPMTTPQVNASQLDFTQDEFGIGSAYVSSAGPRGLESHTAWDPATSMWTADNYVISPGSEYYPGPSNFPGHGSDSSSMTQGATASISSDNRFEIGDSMRVSSNDTSLISTPTMRRVPMVDINPQVQPSGPFYATMQDQCCLDEEYGNLENYPSPTRKLLHNGEQPSRPT